MNPSTPSPSPSPSPRPWNQKLFNLLMQEHDIIATESDMDAIMQVCRELDGRLNAPDVDVAPTNVGGSGTALEKLIDLFCVVNKDMDWLRDVDRSIAAARAEAHLRTYPVDVATVRNEALEQVAREAAEELAQEWLRLSSPDKYADPLGQFKTMATTIILSHLSKLNRPAKGESK